MVATMMWLSVLLRLVLLAEHDLRKSLTGKPVTSVRLLMDRIDKYKRIEEDRLQGKGKAKVIPQDRRDSRSDRIQNNRPRRDLHSLLIQPSWADLDYTP